jgi:hypothetical protein
MPQRLVRFVRQPVLPQLAAAGVVVEEDALPVKISRVPAPVSDQRRDVTASAGFCSASAFMFARPVSKSLPIMLSILKKMLITLPI